MGDRTVTPVAPTDPRWSDLLPLIEQRIAHYRDMLEDADANYGETQHLRGLIAGLKEAVSTASHVKQVAPDMSDPYEGVSL